MALASGRSPAWSRTVGREREAGTPRRLDLAGESQQPVTRGPPGTVDYIGLHPVIPARRVARTGTVAAASAAGEGTRRSESGALTVTAPDAKAMPLASSAA